MLVSTVAHDLIRVLSCLEGAVLDKHVKRDVINSTLEHIGIATDTKNLVTVYSKMFHDPSWIASPSSGGFISGDTYSSYSQTFQELILDQTLQTIVRNLRTLERAAIVIECQAEMEDRDWDSFSC